MALFNKLEQKKVMKLSKDELAILTQAIHESKYELIEVYASKERRNKAIKYLVDFEEKLNEASKDNRRKGRRTTDSFVDCFNRLLGLPRE